MKILMIFLFGILSCLIHDAYGSNTTTSTTVSTTTVRNVLTPTDESQSTFVNALIRWSGISSSMQPSQVAYLHYYGAITTISFGIHVFHLLVMLLVIFVAVIRSSD